MTPAEDTLARTLWGESRGEGRAGMEAVACVILNRAANPRWWGNDIISVCRKPWQFSCWRPAPVGELEAMEHIPASDPSWRIAQEIAEQALAGELRDTTNGADSYANLRVSSPQWARGETPCAVIGKHSFFRLELLAPEQTA